MLRSGLARETASVRVGVQRRACPVSTIAIPIVTRGLTSGESHPGTWPQWHSLHPLAGPFAWGWGCGQW